MKALLAVVVLLGVPTIAAADGDADFRLAAKDFATATKRHVVAWGTVELDTTARRYRFATLEANGKFPAYKDGPLVCGDPANSVACRGAYLIEQAPGKLWVVSYSDDRWGWTKSFYRTEADAQKPAAEPAFEAVPDGAIVHSQGHNHGTEQIRFGFRGGRLAMLEIDDSNRQGDDHRTCKSKTTCPALVKFNYRLVDYLWLGVSGPFKTAKDIREPAAPSEG